MKPLLSVLLLSFTVTAPAFAQNVDISTVFPPSTWPETTTDTDIVTQDTVIVDE